jgi:two-component system NarL family sensor kinase
MPPVEILWYVFVVTGVFLLLIGVFLATILLNQRRFIKVQKEKLEESRKLEGVLRLIPQKMVDAQEEERKRVSKELHDGINQMLASIKYRLHAFTASNLPAAPQLGELAEQVSADLDRTIDEVKRISHALHPKVLDDLGFRAAVRSLIEEFRSRSAIAVDTDVELLPAGLPRETELSVFRILQEALHNIEKHASATHVRIAVVRIGSSLYLEIADNGTGFDVLAQGSSKEGANGLGLTTMKERAILISSVLDVRSTPGRGTILTLKIPS